MFRLIRFSIFKHPFLSGVDIKFANIDKENYDEELPYTSVLIGQNGTGKSEILKYLSDIFISLHNYKTNKKQSVGLRGTFKLVYRINQDEYEISPAQWKVSGTKDDLSSYSFYKNKPKEVLPELKGVELIKFYSEYSINIKDLVLPERQLVCSIMLTDKFNSKSTDFHKYLGVRNEGSAQIAGTKAYIRRTVEFIIKGLKNDFFKEQLKHLLTFLNLKEILYVSYIPRYRNIFMTGDLTIERFHEVFTKWQDSFTRRDAEPWGRKHYMKIKGNARLVEEIVIFLNRLSTKLKTYGSRGKYFSYDVLNDTNILEDFELIQQLNWLNIIAYPSIAIEKKEGTIDYSLEKSSSGESHYITTIIGLLATIKTDSLVIIDEPEISLHPNWQICYINSLKETFSAFASSHFIIATHSHFMLSDLKPNSSSVTALRRNISSICADLICADTYGWSPENILYSVFNVTATRNYYFEKDVRHLLSMISQGQNELDEMQIIIKKLKQVVLSNDDPLKQVIKEAELFIKNINEV